MPGRAAPTCRVIPFHPHRVDRRKDQNVSLRPDFRPGDRAASFGRPLPCFHRHPAQQGHVPQRALLCRAQRAQADHGVVLERLSGDGTASDRHRSDGRGAARRWRRIRRHPQHRRQHPLSRRAGGRTGRPSRQGRRAAVHLGLCLERRHAPRWPSCCRDASSFPTSSTTPA